MLYYFYFAGMLCIGKAKRANNDLERFGWIAMAFAHFERGIKLGKAGT